MSNDTIHIALGVDNNYFPYAGILITSILLNSPENNIIFHIALNEILSNDNRKKCSKFNNIYKNAQIKIYDLSEQIDKLPNLSIYTDKRFNKSILLRLLLPKMLDTAIKKIIYIDADMLCINNIETLWNMDIAANIIGACPYKEKNGQEQIKRLGLKNNQYFNSGMMIMNLRAWQEKNITEIIVECYSKFYEFFLLPDQDAINIVLQGNIQKLSFKFNRMLAANNRLLAAYERDDILLHFVNEAKPWLDGNTAAIDELYKKYMQQSLWNDIKFIEPDTAELMILAGENYEQKKDYKKAAHYYKKAAKQLFTENLQDNND